MKKWLVFSCGLVLLIFLQMHGVVLDSAETDSAEMESSPLQELSDKNFEHDTQASTGQTTGRWLIMFTGPDCATCDEVENELSIAAATSVGGFVAAKVNVSSSPVTAKRFNVSSPDTIPHVILFRDRKMYPFPRSPEPPSSTDIDKFIKSGYLKAEELDVPGEPGVLDQYLELILPVVKDIYTAALEFLGKNRVILVAIAAAVAVGFYVLTSSWLKSKPGTKRAPALRGGIRRKAPSRRPKTS
eukprot:TRINITY_DN12817_c1_g1_i1.p1 TRINITY_DN12817_c1_g1~~TRINITY_DN12817_c1_g1_i1.p1  ORF type:complete len:243 (-),score=36.37 TRINITY_DN12817_c1_g1_i1:187-915(-)